MFHQCLSPHRTHSPDSGPQGERKERKHIQQTFSGDKGDGLSEVSLWYHGQEKEAFSNYYVL